MQRHEKVQLSQSRQAEADWRKEVNLSDNYSQYQQVFIQMLQAFSNMWDGHLGRISVAKHRIDLTPGASPIHSAPYRARTKVPKFHQIEIAGMLEQEVIELARIEWAASTVFAQEKDGTLCLYLEYNWLNGSPRENRVPYREWKSVSTSLKITLSSPLYMQTAGIGCGIGMGNWR